MAEQTDPRMDAAVRWLYRSQGVPSDKPSDYLFDARELLTEIDMSSRTCCAAEPPQDGTWGDCWCTLPTGHAGEHRCQTCSNREGAPGWSNEPDWADLREMARNAGWTREWSEAGTTWGHYVFGAILDRSHGMAYVNKGNRRIYLAGPGGDEHRTVVLYDPTPAEIVTAARLVGLIGGPS